MEQIKRREALRRTAWIMGGTLSIGTIAGILDGCTPTPELTWVPSFFTEDQARLVMEISETILPQTDTPGAKSLGVPAFIEKMVGNVYDQKTRDAFMEGLNGFDEACKGATGDAFLSFDESGKNAYLNTLNDQIKGIRFERGDYSRPFFWRIKELTIVGYYTTEYGATQALQYAPIPVEYKGCIPLSETGNGKTWAT